MRRLNETISVGLAVAALSLLVPGRSEVRPQYFEAFKAGYPNVTAAAATKCVVCHSPESKKVRNAYGAALEAALGAKNVKDAETITAALKAAEAKPSGVEGKTFGDLLKAGELPVAP